MPSSPSSPICLLDCPPSTPQAIGVLAILAASLSAVMLCGLPVALKAGIAASAAGYGLSHAVRLLRRPAATLCLDAGGVLWHDSAAGRVHLHSARWHDFGYLIRLEARSGGRRPWRFLWFTAVMDAAQRRMLRRALNAVAMPQAGALSAMVVNPLL